MKYRIHYWYMFGKALYTEYFKSEFTFEEAQAIRTKLLRKYRDVEIQQVL